MNKQVPQLISNTLLYIFPKHFGLHYHHQDAECNVAENTLENKHITLERSRGTCLLVRFLWNWNFMVMLYVHSLNQKMCFVK